MHHIAQVALHSIPQPPSERLELALCKDHWATSLVLAEQPRTRKVVNKRVFALDAGIRDLADLFRFEVLPLLAVEGLVEGGDVLDGQEVDEGIADVAPVLEG